MAYSNFRVDYHDGMPDVSNEDLVYWEPTINDIAGGWSAMEEVHDPNQAQVIMQIQSSVTKLTEMMSNSLYTWVENVQGWEAPQMDVAPLAAARPKKRDKPPVYTLTRTDGKKTVITLASGVNLEFVCLLAG